MRLKTTTLKILLVVLLALLSVSQASGVSSWYNIWTSHGPEGGYVQALAIDPQTPSTVYAGTNGGGVFAINQMRAPYSLYLPMIKRKF